LQPRYSPREIELKWQRMWAEEGIFRAEERTDKPKYYYLDMYPYPSGELHMGHMRNYIIGDVLARYKNMTGFNVLHPTGWDALGLPSELAAIKNKMDPQEWTLKCVGRMKEQFNQLGISYDWSREINTCLPEYYRWDQWFFLKFLERGLAYRALAPVNWCPSCETVRANEQVIQGLCERCETPVVKKQLEQWFYRITAYADRLLRDLDTLTEWPERVLTMQRNWIGRSEGVRIRFPVAGRSEVIECFTTRADTLFGATFLVLAPEHPLTVALAAEAGKEAEVGEFISRCVSQSEIVRTEAEAKKEGIFLNAYAVNPANDECIPIWSANYVLMEYGSGAIMAVPAHDQRDLEFARQYALPVRVVIQPDGEELSPETLLEGYVGEGNMVNSGQFNGLWSEKGKAAVADFLERAGAGKREVQYRLRDWCISRQKYWGAPIPVIYCDRCGIVPVPENELPVLLPSSVDLTSKGVPPLASNPDFLNVACPRCQAPARREADTMGTFVYSSWYFLRFASPHSTEVPFEAGPVRYWLPVDKYVGGIEHAVMHLLYARFFTKAFHDLGLVDFEEPFRSLFTQGMIYRHGAKMSKSKGNVVSPDEICDKFGADAGRVFILFLGPPEQDTEWSDQGIEGAFRFLNRVWRLTYDVTNSGAHAATGGNGGYYVPTWKERIAQAELSATAKELRRKVHQTIRKVRIDIEERMHFNTAVSALMELTNSVAVVVDAFKTEPPAPSDALAVSEALHSLILMLSPFAPHIADELWESLGHEGSAYLQPFPAWEEALAAEEAWTIVVQVNGKLRDRLEVPAGTAEEVVREAALHAPKVKRHVEGKPIRQVIVVLPRLVNIVTGGGTPESGARPQTK